MLTQFYGMKSNGMKHTSSRYLLMAMRGTAMLFIILATTGSILAFKANKIYADIWQQLGISKSKGEENIRASFLNGYFSYYGAEKAKNILSGNRAAVAKDLLNYTKQQVNSEAFKKEYQKMRDGAKPEEPTEAVKTKEEIRKEKVTELEKSLKESEEIVKTMPDMAKTMQPTIELFKKTLKDYKDPNSKNIEAFYQGELYEHRQRKLDYEEDMVKWNKDYPADYKQIVKSRLQEFVTIAKTVDFNAELKSVNGKKKFVNPKYEGQSYNWKQIFRAGKEVIEPAIAFAEQWIKEIN